MSKASASQSRPQWAAFFEPTTIRQAISRQATDWQLRSFSRHLVSAILPLVLAFAAATGSAANAAAQEEIIEEVVTIGTRSKGRSAEEVPVPVDVLTADALKQTGQTELGRMLQQTAPSFNFSSSSISDGTDALRPATLRGLGPDQTLVLINGKRRHQASLIHINTSVGRGTAGTDMNAIPGASIKRVEVLRDGAAAQYGSDAIAGVINIILKDDAEEGSVSASYGEYSESDGETFNLDLNKGFALGNDGYLNATVNFRDRGRTNRADPQGGCLYGGCVDTDNNGFFEPAPGNEDREVNGPGRDGFRIGDADSQQVALILNAGVALGEGELYGFITYSKRDNQSGAFYRNPAGSGAALSDGSNPVDTDGFLPIIQSDIKDFSTNIGYRADFGNDTTVDVSYTHGKNTIDYTTENSGNYSYANFLRFGQGLSDADVRAGMIRDAYAYGLELELETIDLDVTKVYGDLALAFGAQLRTDTYMVNSGDKYSYFDYDTENGVALYPQNAGGSIQGFNGLAPESEVDESRDVISFYVDGEYQITDDWLVAAAARYDDYDGFGDTVNFKLATTYALTDNFRIRSAASTGFRAPSMQQLFFNNISTQIRSSGAVTVGTFRNDSEVVQALGVPSLKEEESDNLSLGFIWNISDAWTLTVDGYSIDIDDRIGISNQLDAGDDPVDPVTGPLASALTAAAVGSAQFFLNGANTETRGVDIVTTYTGIELLDGYVDVTLAANFTNTNVTDIFVPTGGALAGLSPDVVFSEQDISIVEEWQPQDRISFSAVYILDRLTVNMALNRYGKYTVLDDTRQTYGAEILTDLRFAWQFTDGLSVFLAGNNIFDVTPDEATNTSSRGGKFESVPGAQDMASDTVFRYSRRSAPFGFNGAYYSAGVSYSF